jgi:hypothetical protein
MPAIVTKKKMIHQNINEEKNELAIRLLSLRDEAAVHEFKIIFDELTSKTKRTTALQYNKEIDAAVRKVRDGKFVSNDDVMKEMDKW